MIALLASLLAQQPPDSVHRITAITVEGRRDNLNGIAATASVGRVGWRDLRLRPLAREGELLETVPGMILTQHSGNGKANQMFVRGFNLDHGTDFATSVEGMPVNMRTHGHGQGYTDLNFLIPEVVDHLEYRLGNYYASIGDFGSAGGAEFTLRRLLPGPVALVETGSNGLIRTVAAASARAGPGDALAALEFKGSNGPWDVAENLRKWSGLARYSWRAGASEFSVLGLGYSNSWQASDQIPERAIAAGSVGRFGQVDSTLGGSSWRYSLAGAWQRRGAASTQHASLYAIAYDLDLYSNFTYFLDNPAAGDQINQRDRRTVAGGRFEHRSPVSAFGRAHALLAGFETRADFITGVGLFGTRNREHTETVREDDVTQWSSGLYLAADTWWSDRVRTSLGLRGDLYAFEVESDLAANSGSRTAARLSPKVTVAVLPWPWGEFYLSAGLGFHSNDARGTTIRIDPSTGDPASRVDPLVPSRGAELGFRGTAGDRYRATLTAWALGLDSELLFVGDAGTTEPSAPSARLGVTWTNWYRPIDAVTLDLDASFTRARFQDAPAGEDRIPGALEHVVAAGLTVEPGTRGLFGAARLRHFGGYPLIEDNSVRGTSTSLVNLTAGYRFAGARVSVSLMNAFNAPARDVQYFYASRLRGEPAAGVEDVHYHPAEPRQIRISLAFGL